MNKCINIHEKIFQKPLDKPNKICYTITVIKGRKTQINQKGKIIMTNRDFYKAVINGESNPEIVEFAKAEIEKLDARNEKRRNTLSKEQKANEEIKDKIVAFIGENKMVASEIATGLELSTQKVSALCKQLVESERLSVEDVKVKGKGIVKAYSLNK